MNAHYPTTMEANLIWTDTIQRKLSQDFGTLLKLIPKQRGLTKIKIILVNTIGTT